MAGSCVPSGTACSAAAEGVGARRSAAKSARVTSDLVANPDDHRHRRGDDGAHDRLVVERPQVLERAAAARQDDEVQALDARRARCRARTMAPAAVGPCTMVGERTSSANGQRRRITLPMSRQTAPTGEVTTPIRHGHRGIGRLRALVEEPFGGQARAERLVALVQVAGAGRGDRLDVELVDALRLVGPQPAVADHLHPVLRPHGRACQLLTEEDRAQLTGRVLEGEEAVPDGGYDGWLTSPSTQTSASIGSSSRSARTRRLRSETRRMRGAGRTVGGS